MTRPTFISLFSGVGGFDLGLERAGWECVAQCDNDPFANKVLAKHWPGVKRYDDVRNVGLSPRRDQQGRDGEDEQPGCRGTDEEAGRGVGYSAGHDLHVGSGRATVDLICGGFPCQDLSVAGKRAGLDGARSGLWFEFHRILSELRPTFALIENVPGLLSSNSGRDFGVVLAGLGELWPAVGWAVLDSQHFGVAQRRRRVYVIGGPSRASVQQILSLCESGDWNTQARRAPGEDVAATIRGRSASPGVNEPGRGGEDDANLVVADTLRSHPRPGSNSVGNLAPPLMASGRGTERTGESRGQDPLVLAHHPRQDLDNDTYIPTISPTLSRRDAKGPSSSADQAAIIVAHTLSADGFDASEDGTGRGTPLTVIQDVRGLRDKKQNGIGIQETDTMYTLDGTSQHGLHERMGVRRLTPVECERLQGFPDDWTKLDDKTPDGPRYKACGNAVSVPVIEYIGRRIKAVLDV